MKLEKRKLIALNQFYMEFCDLQDRVNKLKEQMKPEIIDAGIQEKAAMFYSQVDLRNSSHSHSNSTAFTNMTEALKVVVYWNNPQKRAELAQTQNIPSTIEAALENLKQEIANYLTVKDKQFRPFPSALRQSRLAFAEAINKFAEESLEQKRTLLPQKAAE